MSLLWLDKTELLGVLLGIVMCGMVILIRYQILVFEFVFVLNCEALSFAFFTFHSFPGRPFLCGGCQDESVINKRVSGKSHYQQHF